MFVGHFAVAFLLLWLFPDANALALYLGVSFPDLFWGLSIPAGVESVEIPADSPLIRDVRFTRYPHSHSLVLGTAIAAVPGLVVGSLLSPTVGVLFVVASASHWLLDTVVHIGDLPVLGFGIDRYVGAGLWRRPLLAFVVEGGLYAGGAFLFLPRGQWVPALAVGVAFHLVNANGFFGFTGTNPLADERVFAAVTLVGFLGMSLALYGFV